MPAAQDETLRAAFRPYGSVQNVKVIREKGGEYGAHSRGLITASALPEGRRGGQQVACTPTAPWG